VPPDVIKIDFRPRPHRGAYSTLPQPIAVFKSGGLFLRAGGKKVRRVGMEKGEGGKERGGRGILLE